MATADSPPSDSAKTEGTNCRASEESEAIRRDQDRLRAVRELQTMIDEGLKSGVSLRTEDDIRRLARERAASRAF